ncbi:MAG: hypothetical protein MI746_07015 [Pseudomonadales bacterium]|nr:hypothetical protein [Pseudomonadales bacterium]
MAKLRIGTSLYSLLFFASSSLYAQSGVDPETEFDSIFLPLERIEGTVCAQYHNWNPETVRPLFRDQLALFRRAYAAASLADDDTLRTVVTDSANYLDMYGFISNLRQLASNEVGVKYMFQESYDESIEQHRALGQNFQTAKPDVIVGIFWCQPTQGGGAPRFTGGYAYLRVVDGEWKFHTR